MAYQSAHHILVMEPAGFHSNPQTAETNTYQADDPSDVGPVQRAAVAEFRALRDALVAAGVLVTTARGRVESPDDIFCNNWVSTHAGRQMTLYPMLAENRRLERRADMLDFLSGLYDVALDLSEEEMRGRYLESTGSLCLDRVNKIAYVALSPRTDEGLARLWCERMGFSFVPFHTRNHTGKPVYHTDVVMFIGTGYAGVCAECILPEDRARVLDMLRRTHEVVELTMDQLRSFCGNALELRTDREGERILAMSSRAHDALRDDQRATILRHVRSIVHSPIPTIETYGGGSVRCMLLELHSP